MAGFADLISGLIASVASPLTKDLRPVVTIFAWTGQDGFGAATFSAGVPYTALVDRSVKQKYTGSGKLVETLAQLTFLDPIAPNGAAGRVEPIDPRDQIVLDDGATAPIVEIKGFENAATLTPFLSEVTLGTVVGAKP